MGLGQPGPLPEDSGLSASSNAIAVQFLDWPSAWAGLPDTEESTNGLGTHGVEFGLVA